MSQIRGLMNVLARARRLCRSKLKMMARSRLTIAVGVVVLLVVLYSWMLPVEQDEKTEVFPPVSEYLEYRYQALHWNTTFKQSFCGHKTKAFEDFSAKSLAQDSCKKRYDVAVISFDIIEKESLDDTLMYFWLGILGASSLTSPSVTLGCITFYNFFHDYQRALSFTNILAAGGRWQFSNRPPAPLHGVSLSAHRVGLLLKGSEGCLPPCAQYEDCASDPARVRRSSPSYAFGLHVYQDCLLLDHARFHQWPLGPSIFTGFPATIDQMQVVLGRPIPSVHQRDHVLFSMVSGPFDEKHGRKEAVVAAERFCSTNKCHVQSLLTRAHFFLSKFLEILTPSRKERPYAFSAVQRATRAYISGLADSVFTLCPCGKNPESYRIYEAILAGSIPVVHNASVAANRHNTCSQPYQFLADLDAPILFVQDWSELDSLLKPYVANPAKAQALQTRLLRWYEERFRPHLRGLVASLVEAHMVPTRAARAEEE